MVRRRGCSNPLDRFGPAGDFFYINTWILDWHKRSLKFWLASSNFDFISLFLQYFRDFFAMLPLDFNDTFFDGSTCSTGTFETFCQCFQILFR